MARRAGHAVAVALLAAGAAAMPDTKISLRDDCKGNGCMQGVHLTFPSTTPAVTAGDAGPRFTFNISGNLPTPPAAPVFHAEGSLGLPNHPLGIFSFKTDGQACGAQNAYLLDGVLAMVTFNFPPCPWPADVQVGGHIDIWTTLPAFPVVGPFGIPTGFELKVQVSPDATKTAEQHLALVVELAQPAGSGADRSQDKCTLDMQHMPEYPPVPTPGIDNITMPFETLDLDADPLTRWDHIVRPRAEYIKAMLNQFIQKLPRGINSTLVRLILDMGSEALLERIPAPFNQEMRGIARSTGIDVAYIFVYNIMYEVEGLCTSMVSQDSQGNIYHSRNLDFGLFDGTDRDAHNWALTARLRPLLHNLRVMRGGVNIYNTTQYAGFVGLLTGAKRGGFSISVNSRFDAHLDMYLVMWLLGKYQGEFLTWKTRQVMENVGSYADALHDLTNYRPIGPSYIIIGGAAAGEGAVIELAAARPTALLVRTLAEAVKNGSFFVVQTNYDWPSPPPTFDDRRYPTEDCMNQLGSSKISYPTLWAVHSSTPTKNALTTYTTLMSGQTGHFEAYKQFCAPGPNCVPFRAEESALYRPSSINVPTQFLVV